MPRLPILAALLVAAAGAPAFADEPDLRVVPTFESAGVYWDAPDAATDCFVRFRRRGDPAWRRGLDLGYDVRGNQCRGSLVQIAPGTGYEVEVSTRGGLPRRASFATRPDTVPVARTVRVPPGRGMLRIREGGDANGYVVYDGGGATLEGGGRVEFNVLVEASFVVVRGLVLRGARRDAIRLGEGVHDVVIEDNDLSGWGRARENGFGVDLDSGIRAICRACPLVERVTIQRNRIHDPRFGANSWSDGHPEGPQGITFSWCGGGHVIRHNELVGSAGHEFNDAIGGEENFSREGFPHSDADIHGNLVVGAFDDGIESEGGNRNVRIWGNYIDLTASGVATTVTSVGPVYIFRNVYDRNRFRARDAPDADERQAFVKAGSDASIGDGRRYVFHNTLLQRRDAASRLPLGAAAGIGGTGAGHPVNDTISRNNLFDLWKPRGAHFELGARNDFDADVFPDDGGGARYRKGLVGRPLYEKGNGPGAGASGRYALAPGSPGYDQGVRIPNFNDDFTGAAPDVGAHEAGTPPMKFGITPGSDPKMH